MRSATSHAHWTPPSSLRLIVPLLTLMICIGSLAEAQPTASSGKLDTLWHQVLEKLSEASDELEPPLVPPQPVAVRWQARRISSIDLNAPLLALESADVDGDNRAEILALTTRELIIVDRRGRRSLAIRTRAQIPGPMASIRPRTPVGSPVVPDLDDDGVVDISVRSSEHSQGVVFGYRDGALVEQRPADGFPMCASVYAHIDAGRNYFATAMLVAMPPTTDDSPRPKKGVTAQPDSPSTSQSGSLTQEQPTHLPPPMPKPSLLVRQVAFGAGRPHRFFSSRCRDGLVDSIGRQRSIAGIVANDRTLHVWSQKRCPRRDQACRDASMTSHKLANKGVAFELADIDNDGHPEIAVTAAAPPGEPDRVTVLSWRGKRMKRLFQRGFSGGVVGLTAGDIDGDGTDELLAAVRLWGSHRVDMWVFN